MWALFTAAANILEVPETELGGTLYENETHGISLLIYDDVPGGAGHARQLSERVPELIKEAYRVVDGHCGCGEETCCYGCIANYYNQMRQAKLSRGAAKRILGALLFASSAADEKAFESDLADLEGGEGVELEVSQDGTCLGALPLNEALELAVYPDSSQEWKSLIEGLTELCSQVRKEVPDKDVEVFDSEGASAYATFVWRKSRVMLLDEEAAGDFDGEFGESWRNAAGWSVFVVDECSAEDIACRLLGEV